MEAVPYGQFKTPAAKRLEAQRVKDKGTGKLRTGNKHLTGPCSGDHKKIYTKYLTLPPIY